MPGIALHQSVPLASSLNSILGGGRTDKGSAVVPGAWVYILLKTCAERWPRLVLGHSGWGIKTDRM